MDPTTPVKVPIRKLKPLESPIQEPIPDPEPILVPCHSPRSLSPPIPEREFWVDFINVKPMDYEKTC